MIPVGIIGSAHVVPTSSSPTFIGANTISSVNNNNETWTINPLSGALGHLAYVAWIGSSIQGPVPGAGWTLVEQGDATGKTTWIDYTRWALYSAGSNPSSSWNKSNSAGVIVAGYSNPIQIDIRSKVIFDSTDSKDSPAVTSSKAGLAIRFLVINTYNSGASSKAVFGYPSNAPDNRYYADGYDGGQDIQSVLIAHQTLIGAGSTGIATWSITGKPIEAGTAQTIVLIN